MKQKTMYAKRSTIGTVVLSVLLISVFLFSSCSNLIADDFISHHLDPNAKNIISRYRNTTEYTIHLNKYLNGNSEVYTVSPNDIFIFYFDLNENTCQQYNIQKPEITDINVCLLRLADSLVLTFDNERELIWRKNDMENDLNLLNSESTQLLRMISENSTNVFNFGSSFEFTEALYEQATPINQQ